MYYLNLTEGFNPYNSDPEHTIVYESFTFAGGEPHIKIKQFWSYRHEEETFHDRFKTVIRKSYLKPHYVVTITQRINSFNDLGLLVMAVSALHHMGLRHLHLYIPYFPGARQDRVMIPGEPLTVKVYADIINSLRFSRVTILDPHSDVAPVLIENSKVVTNADIARDAINHIASKIEGVPVVISPDSGANKKIMKTLQSFTGGVDLPLVKCDKTRDLTNGRIVDFNVYADDLTGKSCVIIDDICDGGGTFLGLAKALREKGAARVYLVVSHGIFSKGFASLCEHLDGIYTTDSVRDWGNIGDKVKQFKIRMR